MKTYEDILETRKIDRCTHKFYLDELISLALEEDLLKISLLFADMQLQIHKLDYNANHFLILEYFAKKYANNIKRARLSKSVLR